MPSTQNIWDSFYRWEKRWKRAVGLAGFGMHIWRCEDLFEFKPEIDSEEMLRRIQSKIGFISGYFVDISFDGAGFMEKNGLTMLPLQYPKRCNNSYGIWLVLHDMDLADFGSWHFHDDQVNIFCSNATELDWFSMRSVLPYDEIFIRSPKGVAWTKKLMHETATEIQDDLEFDGFEGKIYSEYLTNGIARFDIQEEASS